ncbi:MULTISPECIES: TetR/AcrR family transcriptional regulator [Flavobacteriaceae]|uniref:TetR/AcrR family transcriptional regulator n=1 Tax=Flavobacteriaceae TaxID=49546 RepID=UPI0010AE8364|nr:MULTISPECIES: TetR/AcrR family transcriptional regulator [Flavobacteriaceae]NJB36551.1 TetR/AcrR family transcriptional regulator [Croceivirga sp. JEA036]TKD67296.1 TetR/AcrR family transcriptional regulator [Flavobacterium sp. ASW18X]
MKEKILNRATDLFLTLGFKSVTMDDLAQEMGISKKTIYSHFKNKTMLVEEVTSKMFQEITEGIDYIVSLKKNPIQELYEIKQLLLLRLKNEKSSPIYQLQKYYPKLFENIKRKQFEITQGCIKENIETGIKEGIYRKNLNPDFISRIYFVGVSNLKDESYFPSTHFTMANLMDDYLEYHLRGIVTPEGRKILNEIINSNQQ